MLSYADTMLLYILPYQLARKQRADYYFVYSFQTKYNIWKIAIAHEEPQSPHNFVMCQLWFSSFDLCAWMHNVCCSCGFYRFNVIYALNGVVRNVVFMKHEDIYIVAFRGFSPYDKHIIINEGIYSKRLMVYSSYNIHPLNACACARVLRIIRSLTLFLSRFVVEFRVGILILAIHPGSSVLISWIDDTRGFSYSKHQYTQHANPHTDVHGIYLRTH